MDEDANTVSREEREAAKSGCCRSRC